MNKHLQPWVWTVVGSIGFITSLLVKTIIYLFTGQFDFSGLLGLLAGLFIIIIINIIIVKTKKDKTPSIDERTLNNIKKFYAISPHIYLGIIIIGLIILSIKGMEVISITYLWAAVMLYLVLSGIGSLVIHLK
ncbi:MULTISPECIES: hypothetical protein [Oceanobacillus]|uniref:DUF2178 domain-containing protein n=1 Tax=Oceanobacillus aidingensis TaxID=645964 RepID=A0ABV9K135_9BACI|nr:hypothetical protein [Oceanobacillus oncorhynchi]MDM8101822.1 hypothetical protein [Oceanobacillus oncorhynchi]UUI41713.1 hypothetical protein NP440_09415 [Oceanobacillus oncorhynchi]